MSEDGPPNQLLLTFYGDDFTGSTDALEALTRSGVETALFMEPPAFERVAAFGNVQAVGVAGIARSMSPEQMDSRLPSIFESLKALGAPLTHYKTCSTFDSSPSIGSIGRAMDIGRSAYDNRSLFLLVGVPRLGRYCAFGNLFARAAIHDNAEIFRLDRHPTMSRHPVTPMNESGLREHLAAQTEQRIGLVDLLQMEKEPGALDSFFQGCCTGHDAVLMDAVYDRHLATAGRLMWETATREGPRFAVGSSGVEYALTAQWKKQNRISGSRVERTAMPADRMVVLSGSCSPVSADQIDHAVDSGFREIRVDTPGLLVDGDREDTLMRTKAMALSALARGESVVMHTCKGPDDVRLDLCASFSKALQIEKVGNAIAASAGSLLKEILVESNVRRVVIAGGDTSGHVARMLGIQALTMTAPLAPGCPLCRAHCGGCLDGLEIAFKGGQVGKPDFYSSVLSGQV